MKELVPSVDERAVLAQLADTVPRFKSLRW
jgi:hypothetical protein